MAKRTRRKRGPDGQLYTKEQYEAKFGSGPSEECTTTEVKTFNKVDREEKKQPSIQEKVTTHEKDSAPSLIISYIDSNGRRITKTFQCDKIKLMQNQSQELMRSGPKTTLDIYIEASVIEVI